MSHVDLPNNYKTGKCDTVTKDVIVSERFLNMREICEASDEGRVSIFGCVMGSVVIACMLVYI